MGREKPLCLFPDPVAPASKDTSSSDAKEQEGEEGRGTPGQRKERAPQIPRAGRKGLATQSAAPHADEWETREPTPHGPTRLVARPLSLSLSSETPAFLFLLTIVTTDKCRRILAADTVVRPSHLMEL